MQPLTLGDVAKATGGALGGAGDTPITSVSTDTRTLEPGALFVALRGEQHDGHVHVPAAGARGAVALLAQRPVPECRLPCVVVGDTLRAYGDLARHYRNRFVVPVVGVTGSVGKTTAKEMIAHVLGPVYHVCKSRANFNNEVGVPQTIFGLDDGHGVLVLELAMRGPGQIARLAEISGPTIAVVTNIGLSHIELLGSREAIADAKGELLQALPADGAAVLWQHDPFFDRLRACCSGETLTCAVADPTRPRPDIVASDLAQQNRGWRFMLDSPWGQAALFVPSSGRFNVLNALFAVAVGGRLGVPLEAMAHVLGKWVGPAMRLETVTTPQNVTILSDAYNAAPDSMIGALQALRDIPTDGQRVAVLGEMRELGDWSDEAHAAVGRAAVRARVDRLVLVGPLTQALGDAAQAEGLAPHRITAFATTEEAVAAARQLVGPGDAVLVKGSRALAMERIVAGLEHEAGPDD